MSGHIGKFFSSLGLVLLGVLLLFLANCGGNRQISVSSTPSAGALSTGASATQSPRPTTVNTEPALYETVLPMHAFWNARTATAQVASAQAQATAFEATRLALPTATPITWETSTGFWVEQPDANLPLWSGPAILAGKVIGAENVAALAPLGLWGNGRALALAWSPDGRWLAVGTTVGVHLHDAGTLALVTTLPVQAPARGLGFSVDGSLLAVASNGGVQVWSMANWQLQQELAGGGERVSFSADGAWLAAGSEDLTVHIWETGTWSEIQSLPGAGYEVAFSPAGDLLATSDDSGVRLWEVGSWQQVSWSEGSTGPKHAYRLAFSADGTLLVTSGASCAASLQCFENETWGDVWDVTTGERLGALPASGIFSIGMSGVAFSPDGAHLACGSAYGWIYLRSNGVWSEHSVDRHYAPVLQMAFSADGARLASVGGDGMVFIWDTATKQILRSLDGYVGEVRQVAASRGGLVAVGVGAEIGADGSSTVLVGDTRTGRVLHLWQQQSTAVRGLTISPDGTLLAVGSTHESYEGYYMPTTQVQLWEVESGREVWGVLHPSLKIVRLVFTPDGTALSAQIDGMCVEGANCPACCSEQQTWEAQTGRELAPIELPAPGPAYSPDGSLSATGGADGSVQVVEVATGRTVATLFGHAGPVLSVAFAADGAYIVTGGWDGTVRFWGVP